MQQMGVYVNYKAMRYAFLSIKLTAVLNPGIYAACSIVYRKAYAEVVGRLGKAFMCVLWRHDEKLAKSKQMELSYIFIVVIQKSHNHSKHSKHASYNVIHGCMKNACQNMSGRNMMNVLHYK